jgi:hypothetical protein
MDIIGLIIVAIWVAYHSYGRTDWKNNIRR